MKPLSWADKKKLKYSLGFFAVFVLLAGYPIYLVINSVFFHPPSCFDNVQNQDERGTDCGGVCTKICIGDAQPLSVTWNKILPISGSLYDLAAKIENPNDNAELLSFGYTFKVYDENNSVLYEKEGEDYAKAGESFIVFEPNVRMENKKPYRSEFIIQEPLEWADSKVEASSIKTRKKEVVNEESSTKLNVSLENTGIVDYYSEIDVLAVISDIKGNPLGVSKTYIKTFNPNSKKDISFTWPVSFSEQTKDICSSPEDLPPELLYPSDIMLVFDKSGSMNDDGSSPPQPLTDAKDAGKVFVEEMQSVDWGGVVSFSTEASLPIDQSLTGDFSEIALAIDNITIGEPDNEQHTNVGDGIKKALKELQEKGRERAKKAIVLLTDGIASRPLSSGNSNYPEDYAAIQAQEVKNEDIFLYVVGLGNDINETFLENEIATTPDRFYKAATSEELATIYKDIAKTICEENVFIVETFVRVPEEFDF